MRRSIGFVVLLGVLGLCSGAGYLFLHRFDPPGNWRNPPLYPGAQQVAVQDFGEWGRMQTETWNMYVIKVIRFTTADNPDQVNAFYEEAYSRGGWQPTTWGRKVSAEHRLNYSWSAALQRAPSDYFVDVITSALPTGGTQVEIGVSMFPGY